jgi:hypothetical protein
MPAAAEGPHRNRNLAKFAPRNNPYRLFMQNRHDRRVHRMFSCFAWHHPSMRTIRSGEPSYYGESTCTRYVIAARRRCPARRRYGCYRYRCSAWVSPCRAWRRPGRAAAGSPGRRARPGRRRGRRCGCRLGRPRTIALFDHPNERQSTRWHTTAPEAIPPVGAIGSAQVRAAELSKERPRSYTAARRCCVASDLEAIDGNQKRAPPEADLAGLTSVVIWRSVQRCLRFCLSRQRPANTWRTA